MAHSRSSSAPLSSPQADEHQGDQFDPVRVLADQLAGGGAASGFYAGRIVLGREQLGDVVAIAAVTVTGDAEEEALGLGAGQADHGEARQARR